MLPPFGNYFKVHTCKWVFDTWVVLSFSLQVLWRGHFRGLCWMLPAGWHTVSRISNLMWASMARGLFELSLYKQSATKWKMLMMVMRSIRKPKEKREHCEKTNKQTKKWGTLTCKCLSARWSQLTTKDRVCWKVDETVALGEHCTQPQNEGGVNAECVAQVLVQPGPLKDEPEGSNLLYQFFRECLEIYFKYFFSYQITVHNRIMVRTMVLTAGSGMPALYLNTTPRHIKAFRRDHETNAAKPFWVCHKG